MKWRVVIDRLKKIRPTRLVILLFFVISNSFAWFIYATKVDNDVSVHVRSWNVMFQAGEHQITESIPLIIDSVYPGMEDYVYSIDAYNNSEVSATLSYELLEANIMGTQYMTTIGRTALGEEANENDITSQELENILKDNFPFSIKISTSNSIIQLGDGKETYSIRVVWPYEQNDDETDTYWGTRAAYFKESNPSLPSISLKIKIIITQNEAG